VSNILTKIGIIGWDDCSAVVMSALTAKLPICFVGEHGTNKTDGSGEIARAVLGNCRFTKYDVPLLNIDDLLGYPDPSSLADPKSEEVRFKGTPTSIWKCDAVLFDEINRASPFIGAKLIEVVRTGRVMGKQTNVQLVFAAINPPDKYDSAFMDLAQASRFVYVKVPSLGQMTSSEQQAILDMHTRGSHSTGAEFLETITEARKVMEQFSLEDLATTKHTVLKCTQVINTQKRGIIYSARQAQYLVRLFLAAQALKVVDPNSYNWSDSDYCSLVVATTPEVNGIVRKIVNPADISGPIQQVLVGFKLNDPLTTARSLRDLLRIRISDQMAWAGTTKEFIEKEKDGDILREAIQNIVERQSRGDVEKELCNSLCKAAAGKLLTTGTLQDFPFSLRNLNDETLKMLGVK